MIDIKLKSNEETTVAIRPEHVLNGIPEWTVVSGTSATVAAEADGKSAVIKGVADECGPTLIKVKAVVDKTVLPPPPEQPEVLAAPAKSKAKIEPLHTTEPFTFSEIFVVSVTNVNPASSLRISLTEPSVQVVEPPPDPPVVMSAKDTKNKHVEESRFSR